MKKMYTEPQMIVEDFTVSEMVAADCVIPESELLVVSYMSHTGCDRGDEIDKGYRYDTGKKDIFGNPIYADTGKAEVYANFSDRYNDYDLDPNNGLDPAFTRAYALKSKDKGVCSFIPTEHGVTFGFGLVCNDDTSAIQKS